MESRSNKFGRKKNKKIGKLHKSYDAYLMELIEVTQENWHKQKVLMRKSFEYDPNLEYEEKKRPKRAIFTFLKKHVQDN